MNDMDDQEISRETLVKWAAIFSPLFMVILGFWGAFFTLNDHFLTIREHNEYKNGLALESAEWRSAIASNLERIEAKQLWVLEHKVSKETFDEHSALDAAREKVLDSEVETLEKRVSDLCKRKP